MTPCLPALGVTRIANVTGLDHLNIPVYVAVRPNSRSLSSHQGKGHSRDAAKISAIMEAYECAAAERLPANVLRASAASLESDRYVIPGNAVLSRGESEMRLAWIEGVELLSGAPVLAPEAAVLYEVLGAEADRLASVPRSTKGLAAGNTDDEAMLHGLCELIEHDARSLWHAAQEPDRDAMRIDARQSADPAVHALLDRYEAAAMQVELWEMTSDILAPAYHCIIDDADGAPPYLGRFGGSGCHPNAGVAICRALAEAAQSRLTFIVGTRDDIPAESYRRIGHKRSLANFLANPRRVRAGELPGPRTPSIDTDTVAGDLRVVLNRLAQCGVRRVARMDLTMPEVGLPCVRMIVPELWTVASAIAGPSRPHAGIARWR